MVMVRKSFPQPIRTSATAPNPPPTTTTTSSTGNNWSVPATLQKLVNIPHPLHLIVLALLALGRPLLARLAWMYDRPAHIPHHLPGPLAATDSANATTGANSAAAAG